MQFNPSSVEQECRQCDKNTSKKEREYSIKNLGVILCLNCQKTVEKIQRKTQPPVFYLYLELLKHGYHVEVEKNDKYKKIDLVIEKAKLHIEVDGKQHHNDSGQALRDVKRTFYSTVGGYSTIHIPNRLVRDKLPALGKELKNLIEERIGQRKAVKKKPSVLTVGDKQKLVSDLIISRYPNVLMYLQKNNRIRLEKCNLILHFNEERVDIIFENSKKYASKKYSVKKFISSKHPKLKAYFDNDHRLNMVLNEKQEIEELFPVLVETVEKFHLNKVETT